MVIGNRYPDMLQVGNLPTFEQDRAHFGAWCVISAPLYLGFDLRNTTTLSKVWPIISNPEAIAVNQQYAGHPGRLAKSWTPATPAIKEYFVTTGSLGHTGGEEDCQAGWKYNPSTRTVATPTPKSASPTGAKQGWCLAAQAGVDTTDADAESGGALVARVCNTTDPRQLWESLRAPGEQEHLLQAVDGAMQVNVDPWYADPLSSHVCMYA